MPVAAPVCSALKSPKVITESGTKISVIETPAKSNRKDQLAHSDLQVDTSKQDDRQGHQPKAGDDEIARADKAHETSSQQRSYEGTDAAGLSASPASVAL